jgi:hypothetical protein
LGKGFAAAAKRPLQYLPVLRAGLPPPPPPDSAAGPFRQATAELRDAHHEAISHARAKGGVNLPA